jgi:hypothetical protein
MPWDMNLPRLTMTVSNLSPTLRSLSRPSSAAFLKLLTSSRYLRISLSASSRPSIALLSAASAVLRSSDLDCMARLLNTLILSCTELSREWPWVAEAVDSRACDSTFSRSGVASRKGAQAPGNGDAGWDEKSMPAVMSLQF